MVGHLLPLIPRQGAAKGLRQPAHHIDHRLLNAVGTVAVWQM
jgi:hypothetical protein